MFEVVAEELEGVFGGALVVEAEVVVDAGEDNLACLWPPNHEYVCFTRTDFAVTVSDACSDPIAWRFAGCASASSSEKPRALLTSRAAEASKPSETNARPATS